MKLIMGSANVYVHKSGVLKESGKLLSNYSKKIFIVAGKTAWNKAHKAMEESLKAEGIVYTIEFFQGESSYEEVERILKLVDNDVDLLVGVGGGKALDTTKVIAAKMQKPFVAVPTIPSTCSAVTTLSVMYTPKGVFVEYISHPHNSLLTIVDTEIIADSPAKYMLAGIGDTLAKWYEGIVCARGNEDPVPNQLGLAAAKICLDTLLKYGKQALEDLENKKASYAVQQVTDAIILSSGAVGGFGQESTRACGAHGIHDGLTVIEETHKSLHGMKVAYGIIGLMYLDRQPEEEIKRLKSFYREVGLPTNLSELGVERKLSNKELNEIANLALSPTSFMQFMPYKVNPEQIIDAIKKTE